MRLPFMIILYLSLTPLIGMTDSFAGGLLLGLSWLVLITLQSPLVFGLGKANLPTKYKIASAAFVNIIFVFLLDLLFYSIIGQPYLPYQLYFRLLAFNPLLIYASSVLEEPPSEFAEGLVLALKIAGFLFAASLTAGLVREFMGLARLTPWIGLTPLYWKEVGPWMPRFLVGPAGGFLCLSLIGFLLGKLLNQRASSPKRTVVQPVAPPPQPVQESATITEKHEELSSSNTDFFQKEEPPATPQPETEAVMTVQDGLGYDLPWGESEYQLLENLSRQRPFDKKRILIIGSGTGEVAYEMAIQLLTLYRDKGHPNFRIRGVDTFQTRIETAKEGIYRESQFPNLNDDQKSRYLLRYKHEEARLVKVAQEPRLYVEFLNSDFLSPSIFFQKPADLIVVNFELDFLPPAKLSQLFSQLKSNLHHDGAVILHHEAPREAWSSGWKKTGNQVLRRQR